MASGGTTVKGLKETIKTLERLGVEVADLKGAFRKIGLKVSTDAQRRVPKMTGRLSASIKPSNTKNKSVVRAGSARVPYAGVIQYGWPAHNIEATNYLTDAVTENQASTVETLDDELRRLINKYGLNN